MFASSAIASIFAAAIFVSPVGDDSANGSSSAPLATPSGACGRVRQLRSAGVKEPVEVVFADGVYRMEGPIRLDPRDSGVRWRAANRGKAIFSGGIVPEWRRKDASLISAAIPGDWPLPGFAHGGNKDLEPDCPIAIYAGKHRLPCARWPNGREWAKTGLSFGGKATTNKWGRGTFTSGEYHFKSPRLAAWSKEKDVWVCGYWQFMWAGLRSRLMDIDPAAGTFRVEHTHGYRYKSGADAPFFVLNAECERDQIGEWTVDRDRREVTLLAGSSAKSASRIEIAIAPAKSGTERFRTRCCGLMSWMVSRRRPRCWRLTADSPSPAPSRSTSAAMRRIRLQQEPPSSSAVIPAHRRPEWTIACGARVCPAREASSPWRMERSRST